MQIRLYLNIKEDLIIVEQGGAGGNETTCLDFIPGSHIRAALVNIYLSKCGLDASETLEFQECFLSPKSRFENAYPFLPGDGGGPASPLPLSAFTCKNLPGFVSDLNDEDQWRIEPHGVIDCLLSDIPPACVNQGCSHPVVSKGGYYVPRLNRSFNSLKSLRMGNQVEQKYGRTKEGFLFTYERIQPSQKFQSAITLPDASWNWLKDQMGWKDPYIDNIDIGLGRGKSRTNMRLEKTSDETYHQIFELAEFDIRWNKFGSSNSGNHDHLFSITFLSDVILVDTFGSYLTFLPDSYLQTYLQTEIKKVKSFQATRRIRGWHGRHNLPREDDLAISKGSCFLFNVPSAECLNGTKDRLKELEDQGIGLRREEGFGRIIIDHPFHILTGSV